MSTPRGPADATVTIVERAWQGAVLSGILIPVLQIVLLEIAEAMHPLTDSTLGGDPQTMLYTVIIVLGLLPIVSTLVATGIAYGAAGWPGVALYYVVSVGASMMLGAALTGFIIFMTGVCLFLLVAIIKTKGRKSRGRRPPVY